jgi:hypothetical protein
VDFAPSAGSMPISPAPGGALTDRGRTVACAHPEPQGPRRHKKQIADRIRTAAVAMTNKNLDLFPFFARMISLTCSSGSWLATTAISDTSAFVWVLVFYAFGRFGFDAWTDLYVDRPWPGTLWYDCQYIVTGTESQLVGKNGNRAIRTRFD